MFMDTDVMMLGIIFDMLLERTLYLILQVLVLLWILKRIHSLSISIIKMTLCLLLSILPGSMLQQVKLDQHLLFLFGMSTIL